MIWAGAAMLCAAAALAGCQKNAAEEASASSAAPASEAAANVQPQFGGGVVNGLAGQTLTVMAQGAPVTYQLTPSTAIMVTHKGTLADIKPGSFLGTTNTPSADGSGLSTEVHIFPPGVKIGEGDRPMGPAPASGQATRMTNGTVSAASPAAGGQRMTNGAAGNVATTSQGVQMDVAYQDGTRHIVVTPTTPITVMSSAKPEDLKPGTNVLVGYVPGPGGTKTASFINIQP
jgi:hypothetical protein